MKFSFFKSLRVRITIMLVLIGIIPSIIAAAIVVRSYKERAISLRTYNVKNQCDILRNSLVSEKYLRKTSSTLLNNELDLISSIYNGRILIIDSNFKVVRDTYDIDTGKTSVSQEVISCFQGDTGFDQYDDHNAYIELAYPLIDSENPSEVLGVMVVSVSTNEIEQTVSLMERQAVQVVALISLFVLIGGYVVSGLLMRPLHRVTQAIEDVTDGFEDEAISVADFTETKQITDAFNQMLARVRTVNNSRAEFVSNVSHELKTPLTSMKVLADSLNSMDDVPNELYREFMSDIAKEIDRENRIIQDLLSMSRMDKKTAAVNAEETDIGKLLQEIITRLHSVAENRDIQVILDVVRPVTADVDPIKLSIAFSNLIENAIKYNIDGGWVRVTLKSDRKYFYVYVADCGMGIPEEQQDHIFERFYRVDKSHSTEIEGNGLGLAIARSAIVLHRGVIKVNSKVGEGTTFQVRIPLHYKG